MSVPDQNSKVNEVYGVCSKFRVPRAWHHKSVIRKSILILKFQKWAYFLVKVRINVIQI